MAEEEKAMRIKYDKERKLEEFKKLTKENARKKLKDDQAIKEKSD